MTATRGRRLCRAVACAGGVGSPMNRLLQEQRRVGAFVGAGMTATRGRRQCRVAACAGGVRAVQRADNAGPHTVEASRAKAFTSASAKAPSLAIMENAQKNPGAANLKDIPGFLLLGGGGPVKVDNEVIGAVGVAGAPGGHLDDQCAQAALSKVADLLE